MDKSDVEMEDTENHRRDSGSYVKESETNSKEEKSTPATAVAEDAKESENGEEDPCASEVNNTATSWMESQINPQNEVNEPMTAEGSFEGQINNERNNDLAEDDDGTPEDQANFMKELESFHRERAMDFNPLNINGEPLNFLKLWRGVIRLGGYDRVTGYKLWRQVGESFHPPKTCATIYWAFKTFYEKYVLEYERHKTQSGELQLPEVMPPEPEASAVDSEGNGYQGSGSERPRRDTASCSIQGSHAHHSGHSEAGKPVMKDKNPSNTAIREKNIKSIGSIKLKRPNDADHLIKAARTETSKQPLIRVVDVGRSADWVKIKVWATRDCFEVYGLVPGLLREEVRVQADPAGRLVIMGQPQRIVDRWGVAPFQKIVGLPARINPSQTSAFISLHGRLFVRVPYEQSKKSS